MEEEVQDNWKTRLKAFTKECIRVVKITKKPTMEEYKIFVKVSGIGILLIGLIGYLLNMIKQIFFK